MVVGRLEGMNLHRADLMDAFSAAGTVERVQLGRDSATVTFKEARDAEYAVRTFDGGKLGDRTIEVYLQKGSTRPSGGGPPREESGRGPREESGRGRREPTPKRSRRDHEEEPPPRGSGSSRAMASGRKAEGSGRGRERGRSPPPRPRGAAHR